VVQGCDVVVNAAAWTAVDAAEAKEPAAFAVNAVGARNVALAAREADARSAGYAGDPNVPMGVLVGAIVEMKRWWRFWTCEVVGLAEAMTVGSDQWSPRMLLPSAEQVLQMSTWAVV
jgi:RmlD substrate binding domain